MSVYVGGEICKKKKNVAFRSLALRIFSESNDVVFEQQEGKTFVEIYT